MRVAVGLREGSESMAEARAAGFSEKDGTLGEMFDVIRKSDLVILLISDAAQAQLYKKVFEALRPGATLGLSHGFLLGYLETTGEKFPANVNVIAVCPKGMGPSVRRLYEQGRELNGAGINTSFAVEQDLDGRATDVALAWSVALGAPYTFKTTLKSEVVSDLFGERSILLGAVHGIVEALYQRYLEEGAKPEDAFNRACESLTGPIRETISRHGLVALDEHLDAQGRRDFRRAYDATYASFKGVMAEIYDEVISGNEIKSVVMAANRFAEYPMTTIDRSPMWTAGAKVRSHRAQTRTDIDGFTAGAFAGRDDGAGRHPRRARPPLLGDRERVDHRGCRLAAPLHARAWRGVHGRQLLDHRATRVAQVGAAVPGDARAGGVPDDDRARRDARGHARGLPHPPGARGPAPAVGDATARRHRRQYCSERGCSRRPTPTLSLRERVSYRYVSVVRLFSLGLRPITWSASIGTSTTIDWPEPL